VPWDGRQREDGTYPVLGPVKVAPFLGPDDSCSLAVHPTQLYESSFAFIICGALVLWRRWRHRPGEVFALMCLLYGIERFVNEGLRNDTNPVLGHLTLGQATSVPVFLIGLAAFIYCRFSARKT
jgi:phosphatidylglycerol---prolipoprotein diacylglyceryl transferase